jgi:hypothetical protein
MANFIDSNFGMIGKDFRGNVSYRPSPEQNTFPEFAWTD